MSKRLKLQHFSRFWRPFPLFYFHKCEAPPTREAQVRGLARWTLAAPKRLALTRPDTHWNWSSENLVYLSVSSLTYKLMEVHFLSGLDIQLEFCSCFSSVSSAVSKDRWHCVYHSRDSFSVINTTTFGFCLTGRLVVLESGLGLESIFAGLGLELKGLGLGLGLGSFFLQVLCQVHL